MYSRDLILEQTPRAGWGSITKSTGEVISISPTPAAVEIASPKRGFWAYSLECHSL